MYYILQRCNQLIISSFFPSLSINLRWIFDSIIHKLIFILYRDCWIKSINSYAPIDSMKAVVNSHYERTTHCQTNNLEIIVTCLRTEAASIRSNFSWFCMKSFSEMIWIYAKLLSVSMVRKISFQLIHILLEFHFEFAAFRDILGVSLSIW